MISKRVANEILRRLDHTAELVAVNASRWGIPEKVAQAIQQVQDQAADLIEQEAFGQESFERHQAHAHREQSRSLYARYGRGRRAQVLQRDEDEAYMDTFENPMNPLMVNADEPYMDAYSDDQSSALRNGKSSIGVPLTRATYEGF